MELVLAKEKDIEVISGIISDGREYLKEQNIDQWQTDFPDREKIAKDIENGWGYIFRDDENIVAYSALIIGEEPTYLDIDGKWITDLREYLTVHRVAVSASSRGKGYGKILFDIYKKFASEKGLLSIRIDTHKDNVIMQKLISDAGFGFCGIIVVGDGTKRNAYELPLNK